jgi:hypothetical protein
MRQDFLCLNLCVYIIKTFELPNMKVATILLCGLFCYDIFWVYLSPHILAWWNEDDSADATDPNHSVMVKVFRNALWIHSPAVKNFWLVDEEELTGTLVVVKVARGVVATPDNPIPEAIPIVIRMPHFGGDRVWNPIRHSRRMLGT